jgi:hypothetical protein
MRYITLKLSAESLLPLPQDLYLSMMDPSKS